MRITVFTPTYNRGYIITNLYNSLKKQSFKDFEWIIVDDGSTDDTEKIVSKWMKEKNFFSIVYKKTINGGKHRAINIGIEMAKGNLFFIVDSDDSLPPNSLELIDFVEQTIDLDQKKHFAGVCGQKCLKTGVNIGKTFVGAKFLDITMLEREKYNIQGDKAECFYTTVLKDHKFPEFEGEKFITECVVWDRIAFEGFKMRFFNDSVYICEYLEDGLTRNYNSIYLNNPRGYGLYLKQSIEFGKIPKNKKWSEIYFYYISFRSIYSIRRIAAFVGINALYLSIGLFLYRIKSKYFSFLRRNK